MSIKIDKNIPIPLDTRGGAFTGPFQDMEVNDSFFVGLLKGKTKKQMLAKMRHAYRNYAKKQNPEPKYTAKILEEKGVAGVRVWRLR